MVLFTVAFIAIVALAVGVMALVAVQARRDGREVLSPHGEQLVQSARERTTDLASDIAGAARSATGGARDDAPAGPAAQKQIDLRDRDDISA